MTHLFLLVVLVNGVIQPDPPNFYFYDIFKCQHYAREIVKSKTEARGANHNQVKIAAYCVPRLVNPESVKVYP